MKLFKITQAFLFATTAFAMVACAENEKDPKDVAEEHNEAKFDKVAEFDAQSVVNAYSSGLKEIRMADTAMVYATTPQIKALAQMLSETHKKLNAQLKDLADKKQITLPANITQSEADDIAKTRDKKRIEFDKDYASEMVSKHRDAISMYEKCAADCTDNDIKSWFASTLPELRSHLDMAMNAEAKIKAMK